MRRKRAHNSPAMHRQRNTATRASADGTQQTNKKTTKKQHPTFQKFRNAVLLVIFLALVTCIGIGAGMYISISKEIKEMNVQNLAINYSSFVYYTDSDGNSHELEKLFDSDNRIWLDSEEIPQVLKDAVVAIEDERFYSHGGVDLKRTFGAFIGWAKEKMGMGEASYGGSTITQQVIKNITLEKDRTVIRKVKEMMRAIALERELSKDEILTIYLNLVYLSNNCYGVEAASNMYFSKPAIDLTLPEAAMIAGITNRPSYYDPLRNPDNAKTRRDIILKKMYDLEKISEEDYLEASESDLNLKSSHKEITAKIYSYFVDNVINEVISDLQTEKGYSDTYARQIVYSGGLKIYTTMDYGIQEKIEEIYENTANFPSSKVQSAMVIMDPYNGEIKGMVGGIGEKTDSRGLNRATQSLRQPGSAIKPLSVYSPAIDTGVITSATIVEDAKLTIGKWSPKNAYKGYKGNIPVRKALEVSSNTAAVRTLQELGVETSYKYMTDKYHFSTLKDSDRDLSPLGLGGLTNGVSVEEMAAAYSVFANGGTYIKPHSYTKVVDNTGKVLLESNGNPTRAIKESTSFIMTNLLTSVVEGSSGTGRAAQMNGMWVSGKTGTTNDDKDKWFIGYTPYYVGAVWTGFDQPASLSKAGISSSVSVRTWKKVMDLVHEDLDDKEFSAPETAEKLLICTSTGQLASKGCKYAKYEYFDINVQPSKYCNNRVGPAGGSSSDDEEDAEKTEKPESSEEPDSGEDEDTTQIPDNTDKPDGQDSTAAPATAKPSHTTAPQRPTANPDTDNDDDVISLD